MKKIKKDYPDVKFVIYTMHQDSSFIRDAVKLDVDGYLLKEDPPEFMLTVLEGVIQGYKTFSPKIQTLLIQNMAENNSPLELLTVRERQVFDLVTDGMTHKEISDDLAITLNTYSNWFGKDITGESFSVIQSAREKGPLVTSSSQAIKGASGVCKRCSGKG